MTQTSSRSASSHTTTALVPCRYGWSCASLPFFPVCRTGFGSRNRYCGGCADCTLLPQGLPSKGHDSTGVVAVLLLARMFSQLYNDASSAGKVDLYFLLTSGGGGGGSGLNYQGAKVTLLRRPCRTCHIHASSPRCVINVPPYPCRSCGLSGVGVHHRPAFAQVLRAGPVHRQHRRWAVVDGVVVEAGHV